MIALKVVIILLLVWVFLQDLKHRAVYWFSYPLLAIVFLSLNLLAGLSSKELLQSTTINFAFLLVQWLIVSAYFCIKYKAWVIITSNLLGWGDVLFLLTLCFYFSILNFILFYVLSLVIVLIIWLGGQKMFLIKSKQIPLAGLQSLIFALYLALDWCSPSVNLTDDYWLLHLISKWT